jgi:hypothetical protein
MEIISRADARKNNRKTYYTGLPCILGHVAERYACNYKCVECTILYGKQWIANNREKSREMCRGWRSRNPEQMKQIQKRWRENNVEAHREGWADWYKENRTVYLQRQKIWSAINRELHPERYLYQYARSRARIRGIPFDLEPGDIVVPDFCPVLGIPIIRGRGRTCPNSPSIDRIDPSNGYTKGNVIVVSWKANNIKGNGSMEDMRKIVAFYEHLMEGVDDVRH